jgi:hypothetical protein
MSSGHWNWGRRGVVSRVMWKSDDDLPAVVGIDSITKRLARI